MRQVFFMILIAAIIFSCNSSGKKEPIAKDTATIAPADTAKQQPVVEAPPVIGTIKTVKLTYSGYDEGDYAHLLFKETGTGIDYDFGHPEDNNLGNIKLVVIDNNASFGYKENSKMIGTKFIADLIYKTVDAHDEDGQPKKAREWRISSIKKDK